MTNMDLLTAEERAQVPAVKMRRKKFKNILRTVMANNRTSFSNCLILQGRPGTGKTTLVNEYLDVLQQEGVIARSRRASGHITPRALYRLLRETSELWEVEDHGYRPAVLVLDDVDCLKDGGCLELMKAAFDTKSTHATNRHVYYMTEDGGEGFDYQGMGIIITNDELDPKKTNIHQKALLDRARRVTVDLNEGDTVIYNIALVEDYLRTNEDKLTDEQIEDVVKLFNEDLRPWIETKTFQKANINFSIRLVRKFVESQKLFGDDWKEYDADYASLHTAYLLAKHDQEIQDSIEVAEEKISAVAGPATNSNGEFINPKTGKPYCAAYQLTLRKKYNK